MAEKRRSGSFLLSALLAIILLILVGYLLLIDKPKSRTSHDVEPPIDIVEPDLPHEIILIEDDGLADRAALNEADAQAFIEQLTENSASGEVILLEQHQNQFVRPDSLIALPTLEQRITTLEQLKQDSSLEADTPLSITYTETTQASVSLQALEETLEDHIAPITIVTTDGETITAPLVDLLNRDYIDKAQPIIHISRETRTIDITAKELESLDLATDQALDVTITRHVEILPLSKILADEEIEAGSLLYLHRVTEADQKGLWGILLNGLINKFRAGLQIEGFANREIVSVTIPDDADQILPSGFSSFLGKILYQKVHNSYVYNHKTQTMGNNPNLIYPGQQLIIISFSPDELRDIYLFFIEERDDIVEIYTVGG